MKNRDFGLLNHLELEDYTSLTSTAQSVKATEISFNRTNCSQAEFCFEEQLIKIMCVLQGRTDQRN